MKSLRLVGVVAFAVLVGGCQFYQCGRPPGPTPLRVTYAQGDIRTVLDVFQRVWAVDGTPAAWQAVATPERKVIWELGDQSRLVNSPDRPVGAGLESYACGWPVGAAKEFASILVVERRVAIALREDSDAASVSARFGLPVVATTGPRGYVLDTGADPLGALPASVRLAEDPAVANANPIIRYPRSIRSTGR